MDSRWSHDMCHYLWVGISISDLNIISILVLRGEWPRFVENEVLIASIQMSGKVSTVWSQVSCHKDREEATPFMGFWKLSKWASSVREQMFNVCESHRIFSFSLTDGSVLRHVKCTAPSSGAVASTEMKARYWFWPVLGLFCCADFCLFETSEGYSLFAGSMVSHCGGFFSCEARALGTRVWAILQCKLSICGSSTYSRWRILYLWTTREAPKFVPLPISWASELGEFRLLCR